MSESLSSFFSLLADMLSLSDRHSFVPSSSYSLDWCDQLVLAYVVCLVCSDHRLISDCLVAKDVMAILHCIVDSFSAFQWSGQLSKEDK